jgi:tetratricopeptide repeat protein 8
VLEARKGNPEAARACFAAALQEGDHAFEPFYNDALCAFRAGDFQSAFERVEKALAAFPEHADSADLKKQLTQHFTLL